MRSGITMFDYHIHTPLCNHAKGSMRNTVRHAVAKGIKEICFLDHLILDGPGMKNSMDRDELPLYMQAIALLRHEFRDKISIRAGLEVDFIPEKIAEIQEVTGRFDLDVIGASVHFINGYNVASTRVPIPPGQERDIALRYFERILELLDYDFFDMICHLDVVKKSGMTIHTDCLPLIHEIIDKVAERDVVLEFNAGGWDHPARESYPSPWIAEKCHKKDIRFSLGSDAHRPDRVGRNLDKALEILSQIGYTHIQTFERRLARPVTLRG